MTICCVSSSSSKERIWHDIVITAWYCDNLVCEQFFKQRTQYNPLYTCLASCHWRKSSHHWWWRLFSAWLTRPPVTGALGPSAENKAKLSVLSHCSFLTLSSTTDTLHTQQGHQCFHTALFSHSPPLLTPCTHTTRPSVLSHCSFLTLSSTTDMLHTQKDCQWHDEDGHTHPPYHQHESLFETAITTTGIYCL